MDAPKVNFINQKYQKQRETINLFVTLQQTLYYFIRPNSKSIDLDACSILSLPVLLQPEL
jgi:hypothetical protein